MRFPNKISKPNSVRIISSRQMFYNTLEIYDLSVSNRTNIYCLSFCQNKPIPYKEIANKSEAAVCISQCCHCVKSRYKYFISTLQSRPCNPDHVLGRNTGSTKQTTLTLTVSVIKSQNVVQFSLIKILSNVKCSAWIMYTINIYLGILLNHQL